MWKLSCIVLSLITIGYSSTHDHPGTTEISSNFRNYENQRHRSEVPKYEAENGETYENSQLDSEQFEDVELLGKWRNSGLALEPKWRDGDALPRVPFDDSSRRKKLSRGKVESEDEAGKKVPQSVETSEEESSTIRVDDEETIDKVPIPFQHREFASRERGDSGEKYEERYDDLRGRNHGFSRRDKFTRVPVTRLTNSMLYEVTDETENPGEPSRRYGKGRIQELFDNVDTNDSRSRYSDTFQAHPNEYELVDEEYQKPRPRKRRPPQNYEFVETRAPTYSITWSTEKYIDSIANIENLSTKSMRKPEVTTRRGIAEKKAINTRDRNKSSNLDSRRKSENSELKNLLKMQQIEGLSLSELLQRRNLTLNDLLRGKAEVLNVLKSADNESAEIIGVKSKIFEPEKFHANEKYNAQKNSSSTVTNSTFNEIPKNSRSENDVETETSTRRQENEESEEQMDSAETEVGHRNSNENEKLSAIVRLTKPIILPRSNLLTEKKFVEDTNNEKMVEDSQEVNEKVENLKKKEKSSVLKVDDDEIMEFSDFTIKKIETTTIPREETTKRGNEIKLEEESGFTLSIENILSSTQSTPTISSKNESKMDAKVNAVSIDRKNSDSGVFRILDLDYQSDEPQETSNDENVKKGDTNDEEELTMSDQPHEISTTRIDEDSGKNENDSPKNHLIFSTSSKPYDLVISEIEPEARAEIFELFSTGSSAKRLERLLKSRNMSIDELIELRQRGSSRVHLAEILHSRESSISRNYKEKSVSTVEMSRESSTTARTETETTTEDLSDIEIDSSSTESKERAKSVEETYITTINTERTKLDSTTSENEVKNQQLLELLSAFDSLPFSLNPGAKGTGKSLKPKGTDAVLKVESPDSQKNLVEVGIVEEIVEKEESSSDNEEITVTNIRTNYSTVTKNMSEKRNSSKVRPSIIASGAILGVTIVVFLAIFIVCRIRQKQKYTYRNSFSRSVFQGPAMTARKLSNSSSLNTIMVNVVATSTTKRPERRDNHEVDRFEAQGDIENDSLDANDSWETIPDFMK